MSPTINVAMNISSINTSLWLVKLAWRKPFPELYLQAVLYDIHFYNTSFHSCYLQHHEQKIISWNNVYISGIFLSDQNSDMEWNDWWVTHLLIGQDRGKRKCEEDEVQLQQRKFSTAAKLILCEMRDTHEGRRQKRNVSLHRTRSVEAGKGWWQSRALLRNQNVRLSWWVIRLYKSPPQHTSGPLFSLSLRGSQETSSPATVR